MELLCIQGAFLMIGDKSLISVESVNGVFTLETRSFTKNMQGKSWVHSFPPCMQTNYFLLPFRPSLLCYTAL